jgi:hypothetical protein
MAEGIAGRRGVGDSTGRSGKSWRTILKGGRSGKGV